MILRTALAAAMVTVALPALAQTDPAPPPAATDAPKPYVAPTENPDEATGGEAAPVAPPITDVPPVDPAFQKAAEDLPSAIEDVQVVGPWSEGDQSGVWRTVMMQVGPADKDVYRFFVQKLDRVGPGAKLLSTTEIKEVAGVKGTVVGYRAEEGEDGAPSGDLTLFFDVVPPDGEVPESYELHFLKDKSYTFGPATN
ncbi:hypothetical protein GCM10011390_04310 [Aureimonas endophytica]|uniref:Uncharacterized protein n=1 Tax=Aureimonas endophytica TaxID=2027858 RepID=A0A916ZCM9_9HYPH|nr:hypothetical protein [Aureimonas endophytica]GGD88716.1 hypothetical protein GCM10011390_04310 [Aureimonas endophytica]